MGRENGGKTLTEGVQTETEHEDRYATREEVLRAFRETLRQHERTFRELAKGPGAPADDEQA